MKKLKIFFDGSSHGNPGPSGIGIVVYDECGREVLEFSEYVGVKTNNEVEYLALIKALEIALKLGASEIALYSDSELIVKQMKGEYAVRDVKLKELYEKAVKLMEKIKINIIHISREENVLADKLADKAASNKSPPVYNIM
ncbi:MAG: ribonuclease HI family protein [Nitrososphaerota archaeon]